MQGVVTTDGKRRSRHGGQFESASTYELVTMLICQASEIAAAEAASAAAVTRWQQDAALDETRRGPRGREAAQGRRDEALEQASEVALGRIGASLPLLRDVAAHLAATVSEGLPPAEVFRSMYTEAVWVYAEYGAYLGELSEEEVGDVLQRRTRVLLSRRGFADLATFTAPDGSFALTYDRLALSPLPAEASQVREQLIDSYGGYDGSFGELALALVPVAWRGWQDAALAPWAGVLVFVRPDPLEGIDCADSDWEGDRAGACAHYAAWLAGPDAPVDSVKPTTICGLPAVRSQTFDLIEDGTHSLVDVAWVRGRKHLYNISAWAPDQRGELVRAVHGAFAGFAPAGSPAARDAVPAKAGAERTRPALSVVPPLNARGDAGGDEQP